MSYHVPVLLKESVDALDVKPDGVYVDLTFGGGGHSAEILQRLSRKGRLYAFDQDADAIANKPNDNRLTLIRGNFKFMRGFLRYHGVERVDGILADLGISSHHIDTPERGFSFRFAGALDMRMNPDALVSAKDVVNGYTVENLLYILKEYGEVENPKRVASLIVKGRELGYIATIEELMKVLEPVTPRMNANKFLAKVFQAIRIEVNGELDSLALMLEQAGKMLDKSGRLAIITYHSLEDRLVKNYMKAGNVEGVAEKDFFGKTTIPFVQITRKPIEPSEEEQQQNPRSRSARLRVIQKV